MIVRSAVSHDATRPSFVIVVVERNSSDDSDPDPGLSLGVTRQELSEALGRRSPQRWICIDFPVLINIDLESSGNSSVFLRDAGSRARSSGWCFSVCLVSACFRCGCERIDVLPPPWDYRLL
ncbi:hypothetical protein ROHU_002655 [Labeo rohita]|uniref:Uncharacterized protein n=1 Tax=Labeo rohita TaxID=84645 RepID=A0A498NXZ7_LABRO|nr:hypothetical protein ROHU_002655 [Labeo rohita]